MSSTTSTVRMLYLIVWIPRILRASTCSSSPRWPSPVCLALSRSEGDHRRGKIKLTSVTGYNFKSLEQIIPFLEPSGSGISSLWARTTALKYDCVVAVGYPEKVRKEPNGEDFYNSLIVVNEDGETVANYRKSSLYYTDETWAKEGNGFYRGEIKNLGKVAMGICKSSQPVSCGK